MLYLRTPVGNLQALAVKAHMLHFAKFVYPVANYVVRYIPKFKINRINQ